MQEGWVLPVVKDQIGKLGRIVWIGKVGDEGLKACWSCGNRGGLCGFINLLEVW